MDRITATPPMRKTVLITGSSSGFGQLTARRFARDDWNVAASMRDPSRAEGLPEGDHVVVPRLDVTDEDSIRTAVAETIERFGRIDALVNNAGYGASGYAEEASEEELRRQFDVNVFGAMACARAVLPGMRAQNSGVVVNVTSVAGKVGLPMFSLYSASKFALEGWTEAVAHEWRPFGIRAHALAPGAFSTRFGQAVTLNAGRHIEELDASRQRYLDHLDAIRDVPPKPFSWGDPEKVAEAIHRVVVRGGPVHVNVGKDAKALTLLRRLFGARLTDVVMRKAVMPPD